ncbi:MAG: hypothetical protein KIT43_08585 [Bauldia sp.]|nr:hypothetical protein [Bauldia sp.]MCW5716819.1 hypothetical protein [Bauldia sp.]
MVDGKNIAPTEANVAVIVRNCIYTTSELDAEPRQSEIVTGIAQHIFDPVSGRVDVLRHNYAVILSQDCDLLQDYNTRQKGEQSDLNSVLVFEAEPWSKVKTLVSGRDIWKPLGQNKNERYHLLEEVPAACDCAGEGLPALVIDFRKLFALSAIEIGRQFGLGKDGAQRRCRMVAPYREHLQSRMAFYLQRVGIPEPHRVPAAVVPTG